MMVNNNSSGQAIAGLNRFIFCIKYSFMISQPEASSNIDTGNISPHYGQQDGTIGLFGLVILIDDFC